MDRAEISVSYQQGFIPLSKQASDELAEEEILSLDRDGDGVLNRDEIALGEIHIADNPLSAQRIASLQLEYDADGDGQLSIDEFIHSKRAGTGQASDAVEAFPGIDLDGDGSLSFVELVNDEYGGGCADVNDDGLVGETDMNIITQALASKSTDEQFDFNGDEVVDDDDLNFIVLDVLQIEFGDSNLDGKVDFADFLRLSTAFGSDGAWSDGDFNADGQIDFADFLMLSENFG